MVDNNTNHIGQTVIAIIDYGMGNLGSIQNMLKYIGAEAVITADHDSIRSAQKLILPGVGAFDHGMASLEQRGLVGLLNQRVLEAGVPLLGICLGMQLFSRSSEEGKLPGLGWIDAHTRRFYQPEPPAAKLRIPHMGWNRIKETQRSVLFDGLQDSAKFYFVHSYHVICANSENVLATSDYGGVFHAAVRRGSNIAGTQFHPEKSHRHGIRLLTNFVERF